jgi:hypothetical protein
MSTTTSIKMVMNVLQMAVTFMTNEILKMCYRIEFGRVGTGYTPYTTSLHEVIERGIHTWLAEQKLEAVRFELYDPHRDEAYEICLVDLTYSTEAKEDTAAVKAPIEQLEELFATLETLPPGAQFRIMAHNAEGASKVEGWEPSTPKQLLGGVKEEHKVGEAFGYGQIEGSATYVISNWQQGPDKPPPLPTRWTDER